MLSMASCGDPAEPKTIDTGTGGPTGGTGGTGNPPAAPAVVSLGETKTLALATSANSPTTLQVKLMLTAGDTVDVGLFSRSLAIGSLGLRTDVAANAGSPSITWVNHRTQEGGAFPPVGSSIHAGIVVATTGEYPVEVLGYPPAQCSSSCRATGNFEISVRRSAPAVVFSHRVSATLGRTVAVPAYQTAVATTTEGIAAVLDTIWIRNAGAGSVPVSFATTSRVSVPPATAILSGPTAPSASTVVPISTKGALTPGFSFDTVAIQGIPTDVWHEDASRRIVVELRVNEAAGTRTDIAASIMHLVAASDGTLIATGSSSTVLSRIDPQTATRSDWRTGLGTAPCCNGNGLVASPMGGVYVAQSTQGIARVTADSMYTVVASGASRSFTVGSDGTLYYLTVGTGALARRRTSGQIDTIASFGSSTPSDGQYGGILFNPVDSAIYYPVGLYSTGQQLARFNLKTLAHTTVGPLEGGSPQVVDANGYMYGMGNKSYPTIVTHRSYVTVVDRNGVVVDRRFPPAFLEALVVRGNTLYGIQRGSTSVLWSLPVKQY